ncbi:uncharacterized protein LOC131020208 [Salvia miltiorrhiza]|uniref:uncharacterized protein LOC131020208 n=1 Tax=Salvia miltiorrhiza TaxID=226208 RepID=UPI0025AD9A84|nr:uncharacterized protein LOC131020208 [Salvia miltiorrhiza]
MIGGRRYRAGSIGRSPSPRRPPPRSRDFNPPRNWKPSPYRRREIEEYPGEAMPSRRIEDRDHFEDRVSRFSEYDDRDRYKNGGRRFRSPLRIEKVNFDRDRDRDRAVNLSNYGDGAKGDYDNEVSLGVSRRSYHEDSYRGDLSSMKLKWDPPLDGSRKSDNLSWKDYGISRGSNGVGDVNVTSSGDRDYHLQNHYLDSSRAGLPVSQYLDSSVPVSLKYENRGKMHSDSYALARGGVDDLPVGNLSGGDGGGHMSYVASDYLNGDANRKRYFHFRDEPHLERKHGLNDREDNYFEKKSGSLHYQDRYQGVGKTVESEIYKFEEKDNLLTSRGYLKGDSDYMVSTSQHKDYDPVPSGISREGFSGYSPTRVLHMPSSDVIQRGSRLTSQPIRFDGHSEMKQNMLLAEPGCQLDDKRSGSHSYVGIPENRQGDWSYAEFGRSKIDSISGRVNDVEEDYRDQHISRIDALKRNVDACSRKEQMEDDGPWNQYPSFQVQSTPDKFDVHGSLHLRREDVDTTLGTESSCLNYGAEGYYGFGGVKTEKHHADVDFRQWSHYENSDPLQSRENDPTFGGLYDSPRKRLSMADMSLVESCERSLRDKLVRDEMSYEHDIGIRISADGNGARRIYNQVDIEDEIDLLHFSKRPKSSRSDYEKTWRMSSGLCSDEPPSSDFQSHHSIKPQKSDSRDIKKRLGPTQKLHVSQRLVKYKPSIKKRLEPPLSKKRVHTLPWIKDASFTTETSKQNDPDGGVHYHDGDDLGDHLPLAKSEPPENSEEFKQLVQNAFFKFLKQINETQIKRNKFMEQGRKAGILKCFVCGSNSKEFVGTERLAMHAFTSKKVGMRSQHLGLHKALCVLMGWKTTEHPSSQWHREVMTDAETQVLKEDLIIWPPIVVVHNSTIDSMSPDERVIISAEKLDTKLRDMGFKSILKVCNGKPANQSVLLVKFNGTLSGLREAERFDKRYIKSKHGRAEFKQLKSECGSSRGKNVVSLESEDDFLYGYLGIAEDLDKLDFDTKKRCILKSKKQILSIVHAPIDTGGETGRS